MKILIVTQWFDPEPTFKGLLFAKELVNCGHEVEVITGFPNYPGGKVYDGYKIKALHKEFIEGVNVARVALYPSHDSSAFKRILNYFSFFITSLFYGLFKAKKADVIYAYNPPLTTTLSAVIFGKLRNIPVVIDIQDLWPDTLTATGMLNNKAALNVISKLCNFTYRCANEIVVLSPGFKNRLIERGVPKDKITVIYNWCDETVLSGVKPNKSYLPPNGFNIVFAGNIGKAQGVESIIDAAEIVANKNLDANIIFVGDGISLNDAKKRVAEKKLTNVFFVPRVPMNKVGEILSASDALLVHLNENELFKITIPSRTQAYLAAGKPILMGVSGDASDLIEQSKAGFVCKPNNSQSLANAIDELLSLSSEELKIKGQNAKSFYYDNLSLSNGVSEFLKVFKRAVNND